MKLLCIAAILAIIVPFCSGCVAAKAVGATVGAAGAVVEGAADVTAAGVKAAIPGGKDEKS